MFVAFAKGYFCSAGHNLCIDLVGLALRSALEVFFCGWPIIRYQYRED